MTHRAPLSTPIRSRPGHNQQQVINNLLLNTLAPTVITAPFRQSDFTNPIRKAQSMGVHAIVNTVYYLDSPFTPVHFPNPTKARQTRQADIPPNLVTTTLYSAPVVPLIRLFDQLATTKRAKSQQLDIWQNFQLTTLATTGDTTPDQFSGETKPGQALSATVTFTTFVPTGYDSAADISISGDASGLYSINGGAYTAVAGTVSPGDDVTVRNTSSASYLTNVDNLLTIGGVSATFRSTTGADPAGSGSGKYRCFGFGFRRGK